MQVCCFLTIFNSNNSHFFHKKNGVIGYTVILNYYKSIFSIFLTDNAAIIPTTIPAITPLIINTGK